MREDQITSRSRVWEVLDFIQQFLYDHQYPPSMRQISEGSGVYLSSVAYYLKQLEEWKYLTRSRNRRRVIVLTKKGRLWRKRSVASSS